MAGRDDGGVRDRYDGFPPGFFRRSDEAPDTRFYAPPRLVAHLDAAAIRAVGDLYDDVGVSGAVLDVCGSWVSHFHTAPEVLVVLGMNAVELAHNTPARGRILLDLNAHPGLPFPDRSFDAATCCVSVDYLVHPLEVFDEVARVLRPGAPYVVTFSNRCFPTKAIRGWLATGDDEHVALVAEYFRRSHGWSGPVHDRRPAAAGGDPLFGVWCRAG